MSSAPISEHETKPALSAHKPHPPPARTGAATALRVQEVDHHAGNRPGRRGCDLEDTQEHRRAGGSGTKDGGDAGSAHAGPDGQSSAEDDADLPDGAWHGDSLQHGDAQVAGRRAVDPGERARGTAGKTGGVAGARSIRRPTRRRWPRRRGSWPGTRRSMPTTRHKPTATARCLKQASSPTRAHRPRRLWPASRRERSCRIRPRSRRRRST